MQITRIEQQKRKQNRYSIYVDGEFALGVDEEILLSFKLHERMEIDASLLEKITHAEEKRKVKEWALTLLSYRARSKKELVDRLKQKNKRTNEQKNKRIQFIQEVVNELEALGLINDFEFASIWVRERGKSYGPFRLRNELFKKGIKKEIIDRLLSEFNELELAKNIAERWLRSHKHLSQLLLKRRLFGFLARRGISYDTIKSLDIFTEI